MIQNFSSNSLEDTKRIALELLPFVIKNKLLLLKGDLGSGKTFFSQQLIRALINDDNAIVGSPTFNIVKTYKTIDNTLIYHYDLYRLKSAAEFEEIGLLDNINTRSGIFLIEWPEIAQDLFFAPYLTIDITMRGLYGRNFLVTTKI